MSSLTAPDAVPPRIDRDDSFVLVARGTVVAGSSLDLVDLSPSTIRVRWATPAHLTYLTTGQFLDLWDDEGAEPVPADIGLLGVSLPAGDHVRLLVRRPRIVGSGLRWTVMNEHAWLPHESGSCVLVINPPRTPDAWGPSPAWRA